MLYNKIVIVALFAWFIAQLIKLITVFIEERKINFNRLIETGGMPSSHSALVVALTTQIAKIDGITSNTFAISLIFSMIVMHDAAVIRRAVGEQASKLNKLIEDFYRGEASVNDRLQELLGHTPFEVLVGAALGLLIGLIF